jgi:hypothetical protein
MTASVAGDFGSDQLGHDDVAMLMFELQGG